MFRCPECGAENDKGYRCLVCGACRMCGCTCDQDYDLEALEADDDSED